MPEIPDRDIYAMMRENYANDPRELIRWDCPDCGERNIDLQDDYTHCAKCGQVVWVLGRDFDIEDQKWKVSVKPEEL